MKKFFVLISALTMILSMTACGGSTSGNGDNSTSAKPEVIKDFEDLDTSKFHGGLSGDGYFLVLYEGVIDEAVMGAVLKTADGVSVTLCACKLLLLVLRYRAGFRSACNRQ